MFLSAVVLEAEEINVCEINPGVSLTLELVTHSLAAYGAPLWARTVLDRSCMCICPLLVLASSWETGPTLPPLLASGCTLDIHAPCEQVPVLMVSATTDLHVIPVCLYPRPLSLYPLLPGHLHLYNSHT
jgi:hypothetical protein